MRAFHVEVVHRAIQNDTSTDSTSSDWPRSFTITIPGRTDEAGMKGSEFFSLPRAPLFAASRAVYRTETPSTSRRVSAVVMSADRSVLALS